jgi:hypothetical protein
MNVSAGSFSMAIPRYDFPKTWNGLSMRVFVVSWKPGQWNAVVAAKPQGKSDAGNWTRAFDPQAPGTLGEASGSNYTGTSGLYGPSSAGSDLADVIPGHLNGLQVLTSGTGGYGTVLGYLQVQTPITIAGNVTILSIVGAVSGRYKSGPAFEAPCSITFPAEFSVAVLRFGINVTIENPGTIPVVFATPLTLSVFSNVSSGWSGVNSTSITGSLTPYQTLSLFMMWMNISKPSLAQKYIMYNIKANTTAPFSTTLTVSGAVYADHPGDANHHGKDNSLDLQVLAGAWYKSGPVTPGTPTYNANADFNLDGRVDSLDLSILAASWYKPFKT